MTTTRSQGSLCSCSSCRLQTDAYGLQGASNNSRIFDFFFFLCTHSLIVSLNSYSLLLTLITFLTLDITTNFGVATINFGIAATIVSPTILSIIQAVMIG